MPRDMVNLFARWKVSGVGERGRSFWGCICHGIASNLWKERSRRIFDDSHKPLMEVIDSIIREVGSWLFVTKTFQGLSLADFVRDWKTSISVNAPQQSISFGWWSPPPPGVLKLNFDGSSLGNPGPSGFGCVIRDSMGEIVRVVAGSIGTADSTKVELMGLLMGLREVRNLQLHVPLIEGDSSVVVGWCSGRSWGSWKYAQQIHEIRELVVLMHLVLVHIPRTKNGLAGKLEKWGVGQPQIVKSNVIPVFPD